MSREAVVQAFQEQLKEKFPDGYQSWWHRFLFHFSDIRNIISILESETLYSRSEAIRLGKMQNDNADDDVMGNTGLQAKDFVRFYFGTLTPTQYHNEGFKPLSQVINNAHCPLPVFLLFDFVKLLAREDSHFSSGNIAVQNPEIFSDISDLEKLEFEHIYHRGSLYSATNPAHIKYCRHAEVLIPNALDIVSYLEYIFVRSEAEKETLLYTLSIDALREQYREKIRVHVNGLFHPDRLYVDTVTKDDTRVVLHFSKATQERYSMVLCIKNMESMEIKEYRSESIKLENRKVSMMLDEAFIDAEIEVHLTIDDNLAYKHCFRKHNNLILE